MGRWPNDDIIRRPPQLSKYLANREGARGRRQRETVMKRIVVCFKDRSQLPYSSSTRASFPSSLLLPFSSSSVGYELCVWGGGVYGTNQIFQIGRQLHNANEVAVRRVNSDPGPAAASTSAQTQSRSSSLHPCPNLYVR